MTLQELTEMEDKALNLLCAEARGFVPCDQWEPFYPLGLCKNEACGHEKCYPSRLPTEYVKYLDACQEFESTLLSQPQPAKMAPGEPATPRQRYEFALLQLEPEKPLWAKSARTKTISYIYSQQKGAG